MKINKKNAVMVLLTCAIVLSTGCASTPKGTDNSDPYEGVNRKIFAFNDTLDRHILKPVADAYVKVTPEPARTSVSNFFSNLGYLNVVLNDFLQGKFKQGAADLSRFLINSTVGSLGLVDVASKVGLKAHDEDTGQTLARYGTPQGPYLVIPFLGPNTTRNVPDLGTSTVTSGLFYVGTLVVTLPLGALKVVSDRANASNTLNIVNEAALDRYIFIRDAYLQHRNYLIYDGHPPPPKYDEDDGNDEAPAQTPKSKDHGSEGAPTSMPKSEDGKSDVAPAEASR